MGSGQHKQNNRHTLSSAALRSLFDVCIASDHSLMITRNIEQESIWESGRRKKFQLSLSSLPVLNMSPRRNVFRLQAGKRIMQNKWIELRRGSRTRRREQKWKVRRADDLDCSSAKWRKNQISERGKGKIIFLGKNIIKTPSTTQYLRCRADRMLRKMFHVWQRASRGRMMKVHSDAPMCHFDRNLKRCSGPSELAKMSLWHRYQVSCQTGQQEITAAAHCCREFLLSSSSPDIPRHKVFSFKP